MPIRWRQRRYGKSSLHIQEMGSRYLFIVLHVWLEKLLTRGDYHRSRQRPAVRIETTARQASPPSGSPG